MLEKLGQPVWKPGSPAGWDDTTASWAASNALLRRVEIAQRLASQTPRDPAHDARRLAPLLLPAPARRQPWPKSRGPKARPARSRSCSSRPISCGDSPMPLPLTRRRFVALGAAGPLLFAPRMAFARAATDRRFVFIIQRGAADGLATVIPQGDPALMGLRGELTPDPRHVTGSTGSSRSIRRCPMSRSSMAKGRRCSSMRLPRPIATVRISMARTCSKPAGRGPMPGRMAGSTACSP
jgi:hypothetical protein